MKVARAIMILDHLRDGIDPTTGLALPEDSPMHDPQVQSALDLALGSLQFPVEEREEEAWHRLLARPPEQANQSTAKQKTRRRAKPRRANPSARIARSLTGQQNVTNKPKPPNQGKSWTPEHTALLVREYKAGTPIEDLATQLGRGVKSIEVKMDKLGLLQP